jgi:hypothetical protein
VKPWLEDESLAPELRTLLGAGRRPEPLPGAVLARSRRKVAVLGLVPVAAGAFFWLQPLALGAALGSVVTVGVAVATGRFSRQREPVSVTSREAPRVSAGREPSRALSATPSPAATATTSVGLEVSRPPVVAPAPSPRASGSVTDEALLLEQARRALSKDPGLALAILGEHARSYPAGALGVEAEVLAVDALVHAGRRREAEARAAHLRARSPGSLYGERLRRILERGGQSGE